MHIGNIKLDEINYDHKYAYLGYLIGNQKHINKGYAAEAVALILNFSFNKLKLRNILSSTYKNNIASQKVLKKNRFRLCWKFQNLLLDVNNLPVTALNYILSSEDYFS